MFRLLTQWAILGVAPTVTSSLNRAALTDHPECQGDVRVAASFAGHGAIGANANRMCAANMFTQLGRAPHGFIKSLPHQQLRRDMYFRLG